ncbi:MAG: NAD(P)-dependent oxidoreductase [Rhizomicrobium sp.]
MPLRARLAFAKETTMKVGFIGLGQMGAAMAANLVKAGHAVTVYNRTLAKAQPLVDQGAKPARHIADACRGDAVITMLADDDAVENAAFGDSGIIASLAQNALHISASTIGVALAERLTQAHAKAGQRFVSAPVFGRPDVAAAGKLAIAAAGASDALAAANPLFEAIGQKTFVLGAKPSAANLVKLSGNFLIASVIEALGEAVALVAKGGVDRHAYIDLLTSTLFSAPVYKTYGGLIADEKFTPAGFAAPLGLKDIRLALAAAEGLRVPMPIASLLRDRFLALLAQGGEMLDWSAIATLAARDAGKT